MRELIVFITGVSGVGKSSVVPKLRELMPSIAIHDFDEVVVPEDVDVAWRLKTTDHWLKQAKENLLKGKSSIICGVSRPEEVISSSEYNQTMNLRFGLIKISNSLIQERLTERGNDSELILANINWAEVLEKEVKATKNHSIINGEQELSAIANDIIQWIEDY